MSLGGARGLAVISRNPDCALQAAMVVEDVRETTFFEQVTATEYEAEFGLRADARRREAKFVDQLHANNAGALRRALGPVFGFDPDDAYVRNLDLEAPGDDERLRARRVHQTRLLLRDLKAGRRAPDLVIAPQFRLTVAEGRFVDVTAAFMVLDHSNGQYVSGVEKSFVVRDNVADPGDLDGTRRQAAVGILALREETLRVDAAADPAERAVLQFASVYGLSPAAPRVEWLHAEVDAVRRAIDAERSTELRLQQLRRIDPAPLPMLVDELPTHFQDSCVGSCVMASHCAVGHSRTARALGDAPSLALGSETTADDVVRLLRGQADADGRASFAGTVQAAARALGFEPDELARRLA